MLSANEYAAAWALVETAQRILVVSHVNPDGDAIGSLLGTANALRAIGKTVTTVVEGGTPPFLAFLPQADAVLPTAAGAYDLVIAVDCGDETRFNTALAAVDWRNTTLLNIDHHPTNTRYGTVNVVDDVATSAAEVIYHWLVAQGQVMRQDVALPLLTGLITDTIGFRVSSVTPATLGLAQTLLAAADVRLADLMERVLVSRTYAETRLWQIVLPRAVRDERIFYATITMEDIRSVGLDDMSDAGLVSFLVGVEDVAISCIFKEHQDGKTRVSLRCKRGWNVAEVAVQFGGGGHIQASGMTFNGDLAAAQATILPVLHEAAAKGQTPRD